MFKLPFFLAILGLFSASGAQTTDSTAAHQNLLEKGRKKGYGFSFAITPAFRQVDLAPIQALAAKEKTLDGRTFDFSDNGMGMLGCLFYAGVGKGVRIGFTGDVGFKSYFSDSYGRDSNGALTAGGDSVATLSLLLATGGLVVEKAIVFHDVNFILGGTAGGGAFVLFEDFQKQGSAFDNQFGGGMMDTSYNGQYTGSVGVAAAPLLMLGAHAGITYSLASWLHLGADANVQAYYSQTGFGYGNREFSTRFNPGWRLRLVFGNLG